MVGVDKTVHNECCIVNFFTKITAVGIELLTSLLVLGKKTVIRPLPCETSLKGWVFVESVDVFLDITRTVTHGVDLI